MKTLKISKGGLSITEQILTSPVVTIGRSPACDVVLRAFGVMPVHFLLEWIGVGIFNKNKGRWTLFDISHHDDGTKKSDFSGNEGLVVSEKGIEFSGFLFKIEEDSLAMTDLSGGMIHETVSELAQSGGSSFKNSGARLLEVIRVDTKGRTVEDVAHHLVTGKGDGSIPAVPELKIKWTMPKVSSKSSQQSSGDVSKIVWEKSQAVKIFSKGSLINARSSQDQLSCEVEFRDQDFLCFDLGDHEVYLRYVEAIKVKPVPHDFFKNPLVRIGLAALLIMIILMYFTLTIPAFVKTAEVKGPPRIARIEVQELKPLPPPTLPPELPKPVEEQKSAIVKKAPEDATASASIKKVPDVTLKKSVGLNAPLPPTNVNNVGLLSMLKKNSGSNGANNRVSADMIINSGIVSKTVSGDGGQIMVAQPPAGAVDLNTRLTKRGAKGTELGAASTTLNAGDSFDVKSASPIAGKGGKSNFSVGSGSGADATVLGGQKSGLSDIGGKEGFSAQGGLDKEAVRQTLAKYRRQIRTCYERALVANPRVGGRIVYQWYISPKGPVTSVVLKSSEAKMSSLEGCVESVIKSAIFPTAPNGQPTIVIYPFVFQKT